MRSITWALCLLAALCCSGCKKDETPTPPSGGPDDPNETETAPKAEPAAAGSAKAPEGQPANPMEAMAKMAQAAQAMAGGQQKQFGPVVNWRKLAPFVPQKIGDFAATGELEGSTAGMGGMQTTNVKRRYKADKRELRLEITDTSLVPMLRTGFAMARTVTEDSTKGLKKGVEVDGAPGLLEWRARNKRGKLSVLAGGRFIVELRLTPTDDPEAVVKIAKTLDLDQLAKVK